jgi:TrmH family RNA methyltransferase
LLDALTNVRAPAVVRARRLSEVKVRASEGAFLAEGPQPCREAARYATVEQLFVTQQAAHRYDDIVAEVQRRGGEVTIASDDVVAAICDAQSPQGMVAVVREPLHALSAAIHPGSTLVTYMASVRDPGNAGSVLRAADAAGANGVITSPDSVDLGNPKVVRASVGSLFHLPAVQGIEIDEALAAARQVGMQVIAADGKGEVLGPHHDLSIPTMWVFGNEAWGLPDSVVDSCDRAISLPIYGKAESLNLATAAALCLYASATAQRAAQ